jgi:hypothetical protein
MAKDDAFYRALEVTVRAPVDWTHLGLTSVTVSLAYGDPRHRARVERQDLLFTPARRDDQRWKVYLDPEQGDAYRYRVTYHFDPGSSWHARRWDHALAERTTRAPSLVIDPAADFTFVEVEVVPDRLDPAEIRAVEVHLRYDDGLGWTHEDLLVVEPDSGPQLWRLRLEGRAPTSYRYTLVHQLAAGPTIRLDPVTSSARRLAVRGPFAAALELTLVPQFDPATVRVAVVEVHYEDPANRYTRDLQQQFDGTSMAPVRRRLPLRDPGRRRFSVRTTLVNHDGTMSQSQFAPTTDTRIAVGREAGQGGS